MTKDQLQQAIEQIFPAYKKDLETMLSIPSFNAPAEPGAPFGKEVLQALQSTLAIAKRMGLTTYIDPKGYYGYAEIGQGEELFGVLGHLDVVPAGDLQAWKHPPFGLTEEEGLFYGRGVQDDKGPSLAALYALKILLDSGAKLNKRVRFIFCTDEETMWESMTEYTNREEHPSMGFTPDSSFPLIFAEKGLVQYNLTTQEKSEVLLQGGSALNAVPASATAPYTAELEKAMKALNHKYTQKDGMLIAEGKSVHSMAADTGINAVTCLAQGLVKAGQHNAMLSFITEKGMDPHATAIFGDMKDEQSGRLTCNIGIAKLEKDKQEISMDIRFPVTVPKEKVDKALETAALPYGIQVTQFDYLRPLYIDTNSQLVQRLMEAYQEVTGDTKTQPISSGGATFARSMDNIVAFGPILPGANVTEHQANERAAIADLKIALEVYVRAFILLVTE